MMFIQEVSGGVGPASAVVPTQLSAAMACGYVLWLLQKAKSIPFINQYSAMLNAWIRLAVSGATTLGINIAWSGASHTLTISNLSFGVVAVGLWHWFTQYAATHGFEKILSTIPSTTSIIPPPALQAQAAAAKVNGGV